MVKAKVKGERVKNAFVDQSAVIGWILIIVGPKYASIKRMLSEIRMFQEKGREALYQLEG